MKNEIKEKHFTCDFFGEKKFRGYSTGEKWNGWDCPYFAFEEGKGIVSAQNKIFPNSASYDSVRDCFIFEVNGEAEEYKSEKIGNLHVYPIGSGSWIWEEAK